MAWLSDLAGKAEEVLNTIDKSTAAVLKKEELDRDFSESNLFEVRSLPSNSNLTVEEFLKDEARYSDVNIDEILTIPNKLASSAPTTPARRNNSRFLQSRVLIDDKEVTEQKKHPDDDLSFVSSNDQFFDKSDQFISNDETTRAGFTTFQKDTKKFNREQRLKSEHRKEIDALQDKIKNYDEERARFIREISDLTSKLEKTRFELSSVESELEQHRARALKTLQERDKLINDLRNNSSCSESDDTSVLTELNRLRLEHDSLREENQQIRDKLRLARQESIDAELNAEKVRQSAIEASVQAREAIATEKKRHLDLEEDIRLKNKELRALKEELSTQQNVWTLKFQKQESELSRLRSRLSAAAIPNSEVESRLSNLTRTLVIKQQELENLTTDRNALRLQLEKLEHEYQKWRKSMTFDNRNDTDDAKALLPNFLIESPFDTGVTRKVKRAYSTLDAIGIRMGVFLRRYPLARIFVVIYIALLQFWVLFVLLSQSPDDH